MSRFLMIVLLILVIALVPTLRAQHSSDNTVDALTRSAPPTPPPGPWIPATRPDARFPFRIHMVGERARWDGFNYVGLADVYLPGQRKNPLLVKYTCDVTFTTKDNDQFEARWVKQDRKLEVLLLSPNSKQTRSCRYNVVGKAVAEPSTAAYPLQSQH